MPRHGPREIELKLALPASDPASLAARLARCPVLARRKASTVHLHNVYFDTPAQWLRRHHAALRIRRAGEDGAPRWLQTLKIGDAAHAALSDRGEWEHELASAALDRTLLAASPWDRLDPHSDVFAALQPCFITAFERTRWLVRRRDGSVVEVALDIGRIEAAGRILPICELELELQAGTTQALYDIAGQIAAHLPVLPLSASKSQRGYALAEGTQHAPVMAQPVKLAPGTPLPLAARQALGEMFGQFCANLVLLRNSDDAELVHQARVGWRRFKSARRLFRKAIRPHAMPDMEPIAPLLQAMGVMRDTDVAREDVLPQLRDAYVDGDAGRADAWLDMVGMVAAATQERRQALRATLDTPEPGSTLLAIARWLDPSTSPSGEHLSLAPPVLRRKWVMRQLERLHVQMETSMSDATQAEQQHRARILAKHLRYAVETLWGLVPAKKAARWHRQARELQTTIGGDRDLLQAVAMLAYLGATPGLVEFLRGHACRRSGAGTR